MPARSITRPGIPGRIRNPYYAQAQTSPGANAVAVQQANAQRLAQLRNQQLASTGQSGLELHFSLNGTPEANVQTPNGQVSLLFAPQGPTINKNVTFSQPYNVSSNGYNVQGTTTYRYAVQQSNGKYELVPQQTGQQGSVSYDNTVIATTKNNVMTPTANTVSNPIYNAGTYLGTMTYAPNVSNNQVSLVPKSFAGTTLQQTVPVWYSDPFGGAYKVAYTWRSNPTTYNPQTNQISITYPSMMQTFGYWSAPLYLNSQTTTVSLSGKNTSVNYNILVNPFNSTAYYTGFGPTNAKTTGVTTSSGNTRYYTVNAGSITNTAELSPVNMPGVITKAETYTNFTNNTVSLVNPQAASISGNVLETGTLSLSGGTISFNPSSYTFTNGATSTVTTNTPAATLTSIGGNLSSLPAGGTLTENINKSTGAISYSYAYATSSSSTSASQGAPLTSYLLPKPSRYGVDNASKDQTITAQSVANYGYPSQSGANLLYNIGIKEMFAPEIYAYQTGMLAYTSGVTTGEGLSTGNSALVFQGVGGLGTALVRGEAPLIAAIMPEAAAVGVAISVPTGEAASYVTTGKLMSPSQTVNTAAAGAVSGGVLGWFAPEGQVAGYVAGKTLQFAGQSGIIYAGLNAAELVFGGNPRSSSQTSSTSTTPLAPKLQNQQSTTQSSSSSLSGNNWASPYLNVADVAVTGFVQGASFGTETAGEFDVLTAGMSALSKSSSPLIQTVVSRPFQVAAVATGTVGTMLYSGSTVRQAVVGGLYMGGAVFAGSVINEKFSTPTETNTNVDLNPKASAIAYQATPTDMPSTIGYADRPTSLDALNGANAEPTYYQKGLPSSATVISTSDYQVGFRGGRILYSVNPTASDFEEAYSGASYSINSRLYNAAPPGTPMLTGSKYMFSTEPGQGVDIQAVGKINADVNVPKGVKTLWGVPVKNIVGMNIEYTSSAEGASAEASTATGEGDASYTAKLLVKRNPISQFITGEAYKEIPVATGTAKVPSGYVTLNGEGFVGRTLPQEGGYIVRSADSSSSFFGSDPQQTGLGREYTGYTLSEGKATPTVYYETSDLAASGKQMGIDIGTPAEPVIDTSAVRAWKPMSAFTSSTAETPTATTTATSPTASAETAPTQLTTTTSSFRTAVIGQPAITSLEAPATFTGTSTAYASPAIASAVGYDPIAILTTNTAASSLTRRQQSNIASMLSHSTGIATSLLQNQKSSTGQKAVQSNSLGVFESSFLKSAPLQRSVRSQKTTNKSTQKTATATTTPYPSVGFPMGYPQPNVSFPSQLAPQRILPKRKHTPRPVRSPVVFGYLPDVSSTLMGIHGKKKNKKFYQSVGLSRPII